MTLTIRDLEKLQEKLQEDQRDYQLELQEGNIILTGPSDIESSEIGAEFIRSIAYHCVYSSTYNFDTHND